MNFYGAGAKVEVLQKFFFALKEHSKDFFSLQENRKLFVLIRKAAARSGKKGLSVMN
jgi:hypothetical protein